MSQLVQRVPRLDDARMRLSCKVVFRRLCAGVKTAVLELLQSCAAMHQRHFERLAQCIAAGQGQSERNRRLLRQPGASSQHRIWICRIKPS